MSIITTNVRTDLLFQVLTILNCSMMFLRLQTPALTKFKTNSSLDHFTFDSPEKITHLSLFRYQTEVVRRFTGVEHLYCKSAMGLPGNDILKSLPSLKELHIREVGRTALIDLLKQVKVERKLDFSVVYDYVKIESLDDVERFVDAMGLPKVDSLELYMEDRLKLAKLVPSLQNWDYRKLIKDLKLSDQIPSDLFKTFINVRRVDMKFEPDEGVDHKLLNEFIQRSTYIDELNLANAGLSQSFYDSLSLFCPYLTRLTINEKPKNISNIEFMFGHRHLVAFTVNHQISFEHIQHAFAIMSFSTLKYKMLDRDIELTADVVSKNYRIVVNQRMARFMQKIDMLEFLKDAYYSGVNYREETAEESMPEETKEEKADGEEVSEVKVKNQRRKSNRIRRIRI